MASPFDYVKSVTSTKKNLIDNEELFKKEYVSFIVNRALSNDSTTVMFANEMNKYGNLDEKLQHDFYFYGIPKLNKYIKWAKKETDSREDDIKLISEFYDISFERAIETLRILTDEQIEYLRNSHGGKHK